MYTHTHIHTSQPAGREISTPPEKKMLQHRSFSKSMKHRSFNIFSTPPERRNPEEHRSFSTPQERRISSFSSSEHP